ncbi:MAG: MaoC family dehydratase N-terminal domain-containing protein [Actinobacteria bacterium]|nr:MaoC family dehydratase N-terminal domain-containing protein [Actinomycetota bacterium]
MSVDRYVGASLPPQTVVVERGPVAAFAEAVTDDDPVFRDPGAAAEAGFDAIPTPPTWPMAMHHWGAFPELQPDDAGGEHPMWAIIGELTADGGLILHGEEEFVYHRPVLVGDVLTSSGRVSEIYTKDGSGGGTMTFVVTETDWRDEDGEPVVTEIRTIIHRG